MTPFAPAAKLLRVSKAHNRDIEAWLEARHLETTAGRTIEQLLSRATSDRFHFAQSLLRDAKRLLLASPPMCKAALSRGYYAMYHAMRAVVFLEHRGDDFQEHRVLPAKTPSDFPSAVLWTNNLKIARELRNRADYDPYPKSETAWKGEAKQTIDNATILLRLTSSYLRRKGLDL